MTVSQSGAVSHISGFLLSVVTQNVGVKNATPRSQCVITTCLTPHLIRSPSSCIWPPLVRGAVFLEHVGPSLIAGLSGFRPSNSVQRVGNQRGITILERGLEIGL